MRLSYQIKNAFLLFVTKSYTYINVVQCPIIFALHVNNDHCFFSCQSKQVNIVQIYTFDGIAKLCSFLCQFCALAFEFNTLLPYGTDR